MGDNYSLARKETSQVPGKRIYSHYSENYEVLMSAFGEFMHKVMPIIIKSVLQKFIPSFLSKNPNFTTYKGNITKYFNLLFHHEILSHFGLPKDLDYEKIVKHIRDKEQPNIPALPPEIIMIYGESGIFIRLINDFIDNLVIRGSLNIVTNWEDIEKSISVAIMDNWSLDETLFSNKLIRCGGKAFSLYMFRLLSLNYVLYRRFKGQKYFIPSDIYSTSELKEHFESNFREVES